MTANPAAFPGLPPLILGANVFGWGADEATSFALLDAAVEQGLNAIDTADIYSYWAPGNHGGESETIIGRWLKRRGRRDDVIIHTKGGAPGAPDAFADAKADASYLPKAVDASLRRLGIETIDLYYVHYDDKVTPPEETLAVFDTLIRAGKIRAIGASNYAPDRLAASLDASDANRLPRFACLQTGYNLYDRAGYEAELEPLCADRGLGVMSYYGLAKGFLTGKYRSGADLGKSAARGGAIESYLTPRGFRILGALDRVAEETGSNPTQVALAWLIARPSITAPIASATSLTQLADLPAACRLRLDGEAIAQLDAASAESETAAA
ncbi:aldo/keto reductase [Ancylobacter sp. 6x-1]|uniref:Aldo/keto reductase n=1 Tax=Ancylobacter crimeensis TaxID=2579147 RepID=A0ABT0DE34_9HYPH|nr:aldo/keto reductase [Ancylobacter crimeensis]MCK0198201.1 aldo/keto reductase [Ancylobacter crimeensis]